ncbi:tail completion protein gp17 [Anatilimnocola floriformis]|uniref:tail completion protein gp17 n=1 Tax=Anatilimnocola floriformis TaxID=2948575 RepID=UPI0020C24047|nr:minor capsid protein [Anatilimnocola floriformis]
MIRSSLRQYLATNLANLVGSRIFPLVLPQSAARPAITYARTTGGHDHNLKQATGSAIPVFELDCWADSYEAADQLAEAVRQKMQGFSGTMGSVSVRAVILDDEVDAFEVPSDGSDNGIYRISLKYRIRYDESIPTF